MGELDPLASIAIYRLGMLSFAWISVNASVWCPRLDGNLSAQYILARSRLPPRIGGPIGPTSQLNDEGTRYLVRKSETGKPGAKRSGTVSSELVDGMIVVYSAENSLHMR